MNPIDSAPLEVIDLRIIGMTCASCVARVERKLSKIPGVQASVDLATESARVLVPANTLPEQLIDAVRTAGYAASVRVLGDASADDASAAHFADLRRRLIVATILGLPVILLSMVPPWQFIGWQWWAGALATPIALWCALPFHIAAWRQLRHKSSSMDTLVSLGILAAWFGSAYALLAKQSQAMAHSNTAHVWFEVVAAVTVFLLLGRLLEHRATRESGAAIRALLDVQAPTATRVSDDGSYESIPTEFVVVGNTLLVNPGDIIPVDGVVLSGASAVDESMLTGESVPIDVAAGSAITGGTVAVNGRITIRATAVGAATRLARITALVSEAHSKKSQTQRLADRISSIFVPIVLGIAVLTAGAWALTGHGSTAVTAALAVLVVACPCALGLATPTAMLAGVGRGAQLGILIGGPEVLERARRISMIVFDKTGTLTKGQLHVVAHHGIDELANWQWRALSAVAAASNHPASRAISQFVLRRHVPVSSDHSELATVDEVAGNGISATFDGRALRLGKPQWTSAIVRDYEEWRAVGFSVVSFSIDDHTCAAFAIADEVRTQAASVVADARNAGLTPWLVTGDHEAVAQHVAQAVGIASDHVCSSISPEGKAELVVQLGRDGGVMMVGDGINDAAALASATIGVAMGSGTGAAIAASDITVVGSRLDKVVPALTLARKTLHTIKTNLFWAFAYNIIMIPLAALGKLDPMLAGISMAASSVLVVSNSLRLRHFAR